MELTSHEQKILDIVNNHPEILDNPEKRTQIAELYGLSEKTLRNRIAELKKRGAISTGKVDVPNINQGTVLDLDIFSLWAILRSKKIFIIKRTSAISVLNNSLQGIAESFGLGGISSGQTFNIPDIINSQRLKKAVVMNQWENEKFSEQKTLIKYWELDISNKPHPKDSELKSLIENSVMLRKRSDVEIGSYLSGGLDSTILSYILNPNHT